MVYFGLENNIHPLTSDLAKFPVNGDFPVFSYEILVFHNKIPFWDYHKLFFKTIATKLGVKLPVYFDSYNDFITRLVNRNKFFNGALIRVVFYPVNEQLKFFAFPQKFDISQIGFSDDKIVVYDNHSLIKHIDEFSFVRQFCAHHYHIYNRKFDKPQLIYGYDGKILETQQGNILIRKGDYIISPNYTQGAFYNAFHQYLIHILKNNFNYQINFDLLDMQTIKNADEVWIITWNNQIVYKVGVNRFRYDKRLLKEQTENLIKNLFGTK